MIILDKLVQGSKDWLDARCAVITSSRFDCIITPTGKAVTGAKRETYMLDLAHEKITGKPIFILPNFAMQRGADLEPEARENFEFIKNIVVNQVGIVYRDESKRVSCSPDGLIGRPHGLEIKCPMHANHLRCLITKEMPKEHIQQVQGSIWITGRESWWFMSYHPDHKPFIKLILRDNNYIEKLEMVVNDFKSDLDDLINGL